MKTKKYYSEQILLSLSDGLRNRDEKIDEREVIIFIDNLVNEAAKKGFFENWKLGLGQLDEQFITRWEYLTVNDPDNEGNSYFAIPANYVNLPRNQGIYEVYFQNSFTDVKKKYFDPIHVVSQKDVTTYRSNMAGSLQGRLSVYPRNGNLYFNTGNIAQVYGDVGLALVIKDSSQIADDAPYPVPADLENKIIQDGVAFFRARRMQPTDLIRDQNDKP